MNNIWVTSDYHFNHDKDFIWKARGYSNIEEMNEDLIKKTNMVVKPDDDLYILGDLCLGDLEKGRDCLSRLNGRIHVVYGNHDTDRRKQMYSELSNYIEGAYSMMLRYKKYHFYLSHFPTITANNDNDKPLKQKTLNLFGHTHQTNPFYEDADYMFNCGVDAHDGFPISLDVIRI